ncbi:MAG: tetratricopeptide repeat protein [Myxococcales bacterium]|nr:tetratricopeptide repeat protein [Myxococcales bacterium]
MTLLTLVAAAFAGAGNDVVGCLALSDLACAQAAAAGLGDSAEDRAGRAELAFHLGEFAAARDGLKGVVDASGDPDLAKRYALFERVANATADFTTHTRADVTLRYRAGMDDVLLDEALETLQAAHDEIGPILGGAPPGGVRMELFPTAQRFIDASSLPGDAVRKTGVIALSKWTRLLVSSPRALGRGYGWKDTIAHEYIHYIVAWRTKDQAPVWLQEGIARSHESMWRQDEPAALTPTQESLLATALGQDKLVPLSRMHPSMAFLDSADEAALAFAQVSTMIVHLRRSAGPDAVSRVLDRVRGGTDALQAVADVGAGGSTTAFLDGWKGYLKSLKLVSRKLAESKVILDGAGDDFETDPQLGQRMDLARFARLGDILLDHGQAGAALVEFHKAAPPDEPPSPILSVRTAEALLALGRVGSAQAVLSASAKDYPEHAPTRVALGKLLLATGDTAAAFREYRAGVDVDPFDSAAQAALAALYAARGDTVLADRHRRYARLLTSTEPATR